MTETLFAFDLNNFRECQASFRGDRAQEYYLGDYTIEAGSVIDVRAERKAVGPCSLIRLRSRTRLFFRRAWSHIREDATDVTVLWFVKRGSLSVSGPAGDGLASAGDFALTRSMTPFAMECRVDAEAQFEVFHVVLPTHLFRRAVQHEPGGGFCVSAGGRAFRVAERILLDVFQDGEDLSANAQRVLVDGALTLLAEAIDACSMPARQSLAERRLQEVLRYIEVHLSDPRLDTQRVASACGISPRYLSYLLKQNHSSFSALVWEQRLQAAERLLVACGTQEMSVAEIAFRVGFKSPAHFSRMFKRVFGKGPREYRGGVRSDPAAMRGIGIVRGGSATLQ
jgi:AraC-like DNA-binding protein